MNHPEVIKFESFEEMKASGLRDISLPISEEELKKNLDAYIAISLLNPKNKHLINCLDKTSSTVK
jgi:hypothetical protein